MQKHTEYCTCFYSSDNNEVIFFDEIEDKTIGKQKVTCKQEADNVMRFWQDSAPEGAICQILVRN